MTYQVIFGAIFGLLDILLSIDAFANWFFEKVKLLKKKKNSTLLNLQYEISVGLTFENC